MTDKLWQVLPKK